MGYRPRHIFDGYYALIVFTVLLVYSCMHVVTFFADAATSCDLFLFLSGGNVNIGDGRVIVEPPADSSDAIAAPRHCVALDYL
jgi:hypothetical protein